MTTLSGEKRLFWVLVMAAILLLVASIFVLMSHKPASLVVLPNARYVEFTWITGSKEISYEITEPYPAKAALKEISDQLATQGYRPLGNDYSWIDFIDLLEGEKTPSTEFDVCHAKWQDPRGNVVEYVLQYRSPREGPLNRNELLVHGIVVR